MGDVCESARLGHMSVDVHTGDGTVVSGVPDPRPVRDDDPSAIDGVGYARELSIAGTTVLLDDVRQVVLTRP